MTQCALDLLDEKDLIPVKHVRPGNVVDCGRLWSIEDTNTHSHTLLH